MSGNDENTDEAAAQASRRLQVRVTTQKRRRWKAVGFIVLLVLAGGVIGVGATVVYFRSQMYRRPPKPQDLGRVIVDRLNEVVELTPQETAIMRERTEKIMAEVEKIRKESFDRIHGIFDNANEELRQLIGDDRHAKWEKYKEEHRGGRRGPRHGSE